MSSRARGDRPAAGRRPPHPVTWLAIIQVPLVLLDDDSTGAQAATSVPIVLRPSPAALREATGRRAAYLVTNSRALCPPDAAAVTREAAEAVLAQAPAARLVLRGDSTLRAHFVEEHDAVCRARGWEGAPAVLVPALPAAGRVTRDGIHYLLADGAAVPIGETEFARDPGLGYRPSHLLEWAESRSAGRFRAADGAVVGLDVVRGPAAAREIAAAIDAVARGPRPGVVALDAETDDDIRALVSGLEAAFANETRFVLRCSPAPAAALARATARATIEVPGASRVLVLCGSFVEQTTRQLALLVADNPGTLVEIDLASAAADSAAEGRRTAARARQLVRERSLAVVATPRVHRHGHAGRDAGDRLTEVLQAVAAELAGEVDLLILKGGATSAAIVSDGLRADLADVVGPVGHGASLWSVPAGAGALPVVVAPGNVGADGALVDLVARARGVAAC
ncbi:MAG TPA: four-carbon acid sugar kinase family protein [Kofleriaceae bacterium]|nr:four-carbon acid sugar kinase family protein [Kofleriaceae bacterium]